MSRRLRTTGRLLWHTIEACQSDNTPLLAASLSFFTLLSMVPALWVVITFAGAWVGKESARAEVIQWTTNMVGVGAAGYVGGVLRQVEDFNYVATLVGVVSMFFGASLAFGALYDSLNRIWRVPPRTGRRIILGYFTKRLLAFVLVLIVGLLMLASLLLTTVVATLARLGEYFFPIPQLLLQAINAAISMALVMLLFAAIYRILHDAKIEWHDVWVGATVTAVLFAAGKTVLALYLASAGLVTSYGAAGSLVVLLLWIYYSAQIFLFGAEFTEVYSRTRKRTGSAV
jgi:membrane protein